MSQPEGTSLSRLTRLRCAAVGTWNRVQLLIERRGFERKLEAIVRAALAHESSGLAAGSRLYKLLSRQADSICAEFTARWKTDPNLLDAQIPALSKLKSLANPPPKPSPAAMVSLGVICAMALFFLLGIFAGLTSVAYHLVGGH